MADEAIVGQDHKTIPALVTKAMVRRFYLPIGDRTLTRWIASERFPRPDIAMGGKVRLWKRETVEQWIADQAQAGDQRE